MKRHIQRGLAAPTAVLALLVFAGAAPGQILPGASPTAETAAPAEAEAPVTPEALEAERAELGKEMEGLRAALETANEGSQARLLARIDLLERIDRALSRRATLLRDRAALEAQPAQPADLLGAGPPYSLALLDAAGLSLQAHRRQAEAFTKRVERGREAVANGQTELEEQERLRRRLREEAAAAADAVERTRLEASAGEAELGSRLARERLSLAKTELALAELESQRLSRQIELLEDTRTRIRRSLTLDRFDLDEPLRQIALEREATRRALENAQANLATADRHLADVTQRSQANGEPPPALRAELDARRAERNTAQWQVALHDARLRQLDELEKAWQQRWQALAGRADEATVLTWQQELERQQDELRRQLQVADSRKAELTRDLDALRAASPDEAELPWQERRVAALEKMASLQQASRAQTELQRDALGRAISDLRFVTDTDDDGGPGGAALLARARDLFGREVFVVDDRSITAGKLAVALLLFVMGVSLSRLLARGTGRLLYKRLSAPGAAYAFERLTFYGLLVAFFLLALRLVNIPLTAFALLGGALAIGLGFGSQNVINNFISGLILLVERPMKVGDIVDVDGVSGIVERVGPRSTRVRTFDNLHIIVPNSAFLERNVVNWTLSDQTVRRLITVGVAYGTNTREAGRLVRRALDEHGRVLAKPEPMVLLWDFGNDALIFRAYFWLQLQPNTSFLEIESDLRHRVNHLFREAGITIAFPQRDVHLDVSRPLEVRVAALGSGETPES